MIRLTLLCVFILSILSTRAQQEYNNVDYKNYRQALEVFKRLDVLEYSKIISLNMKMDGTYYFEGHFPVPRERRAYDISEKVEWTKMLATSESALIDGKGTFSRKEQITEGEILIMDYTEKELRPKSFKSEVNLPFYSPVFVYNDILQNKQSIRYMGYDQGSNCEVIVYSL